MISASTGSSSGVVQNAYSVGHDTGASTRSRSNKDISTNGGSIGLWATSAVDSFYSSQKSAYLDPDQAAAGDSLTNSVFEMDPMTASLLRRRGEKKNRRSGRKATLTAAIGAPKSTRTLGLSFMGNSTALEVENSMRLDGHTRVRKSNLNLIGKAKRRKATDAGGAKTQINARSVALDRALNTCLEAHFEVERAKLH
jgi:hypothetical protein